MADPKYVNLPGIDLNSPDVFETSDLPEDEQQSSQEPELPNENIEKTSINTDAAFKVFKGKTLTTDFSDSVSKSRNIGYFADKDEYELAEAGAKTETYQQKFQRLQHEMRELAEELGKVKENVKGEGAGMSPVELGKNLEYLQHQLAGLHLEKLVGPEASVDIADPQGALRQRLVTQLQSFRSAAPIDKKASSAAPSSSDQQCVSYELYYRPEQAKFSKNAKIASLEERLERLENVIGKAHDKTTVLTADTDNKSLIGAVGSLNSKLSLLDAANTDTVEARLNAVLQKMQQVADKKEKEPQADPEKQKKISELYEIVKKWEATAESLPQVVDRLMSLKELHEQALQFSQALTYLDTAQQEVKGSLTSHQDMLKKLQTSIAENTETTQKNIGSIDKRLQALNKS